MLIARQLELFQPEHSQIQRSNYSYNRYALVIDLQYKPDGVVAEHFIKEEFLRFIAFSRRKLLKKPVNGLPNTSHKPKYREYE